MPLCARQAAKVRGAGTPAVQPAVPPLAGDEVPSGSAARDTTHMTQFSPSRQARAGAKPNRHETIEFRLIFAATFAIFLLTSVLERALPHKWAGRAGGEETRKSVIEQAREAAHISAGYAFMG